VPLRHPRRIVRAVLRVASQGPGSPDLESRPERADAAQSRPVTAESERIGARPAPAGAGSLPGSLATNPVLGRWLDFGRHSEVTVRVGKVEYGQGIWTALAQVAAEELQVDLAQVRMAPVSTSTSPDEGVTSGSRSVQDSGSALRQACAQARELLLAAAADRLAGHPAALSVTDGQILASGRPTGLSYWSLATPGTLDRSAGDPVPTRPPGGWIVAGRAAARLDLPDKVTGRPRFIHDLVLPGMLFGRVVRPPSVAAELSELPAVRLGSVTCWCRTARSSAWWLRPTELRCGRRGGWRARRCGSWRTLPVRCPTSATCGPSCWRRRRNLSRCSSSWIPAPPPRSAAR
jgi:hypothetical protein